MKKNRSFLSTVMMLISVPLAAMAEIDPTNIAETDRVNLYGTTASYTYDNAGNVIKIEYTISIIPPYEPSRDDPDNPLIDDAQVCVKADDSWEHVSISILGGSEDNEVILNIFSVAGINCFTTSLNNTNATLNLSSYTKGIYLFRFTIGKTTKVYKLIKH